MNSQILNVGLVLLCASVACAETNERVTYSNAHHGFSFDYPKAWTLIDRLNAGGALHLNSPEKTEEGRPVAEILFGVVGISKKMDLKLFEKLTLMPEHAAEQGLTLDLNKASETTLGGLKGRCHNYSRGEEAESEQFRSCLTLSSERGFCFTFVAARANFKKHEAVFNAVLASFKTGAPDGKDSVFRNKEFGFGIDYPVTWNATANRPDTVIIKAPQESPDEKVPDMLYMGCIKRIENVTDETMAKNAFEGLKRNPQATVLEPLSELKIGKFKAYRYAVSVAEREYTAQNTEYVISCEDYLIHMICINDVARKETSAKIFDSMLKTFVVEKAHK